MFYYILENNKIKQFTEIQDNETVPAFLEEWLKTEDKIIRLHDGFLAFEKDVDMQAEERIQAEQQFQQLKQSLINAVQSFMDETARTRGYDNVASACSYANDYEPNETFKQEGKACVLWRSAVWSYCYEQLALFESGQRSVPTAEELIAELPVLNWGDQVV